MIKPYLHYAWHLSYFSGKTRSYLRYKDIPFVEKTINMYTFAVEAKKKTGAAVMPIVVTPEGEWLQDTSVIIDRLEANFPKAPVVPHTPVQKIASYLMEMWGDEWWLVVAMYTRWFHPENYPLFLHDAGSGLLPWFPRFLQNRVGAKAAKPDKPVLVLHGDGSFGMNAMEMDTAVRHNLPIVTVISLNGGWTADPEGGKIGRQLGYQRYEKLMDAFGGHGEYVEQPADIRPALERAFASGKAAIVNVKTDFRARATTMRFTDYTT